MKNRFVILYDEDAAEAQKESDSEILQEINNNLVRLNENLEQASTEEASTEETSTEVSTEEASTEEASTEGIIYKDSTADTHNYLSTLVENATINDLYTVALSVRNVLLLFVLVFFGLKAFGALKNVIYRIMNK